MKINQAGLDLIKSFEGCKLKAYQDVVGIWTVGYGHTGADVKPDMEINQAAAEAFLKQDLERFEVGVGHLLTNPRVNSNQFSALVCFAYNCGLDNLKRSTLLRCINKGNLTDAAEEFLKWDKAGGRVIAGLTRRREAEKQLYKSVVS